MGLGGPRKDPLVMSGGTVSLGLSPLLCKVGGTVPQASPSGKSCLVHARRSSGAAGVSGKSPVFLSKAAETVLCG